MPSQAHMDVKAPDFVLNANVGRKQSFRGFSASSLSSLALGRNHSKRISLGTSKSMNFLMSSFRDSDSSSEKSRPPSLVTDNSSLTSVSSRSPSPEPVTAISRLEAAFKSYSTTESPKILQNILLPALSLSQARSPLPVQSNCVPNLSRVVAQRPASTTAESLLEESDINVLFKWWNHLLLLSAPTTATFQAIYAIAAHSSLRDTVFWNAHYELTLSTTLSQPSGVLSSISFAKLAAIGYIYHPPTSQLLRNLFTDPTKVHSAEPWVKRAKNVEVFIETSKHVFSICPTLDDGGVIEARLEEMLNKVITVTTYPNHRLGNLRRLLANADDLFSQTLENCLVRIAERVGVFDSVSVFYLFDVLSAVKLTRVDFWLEVLERVITTENHILQIRAFAFMYDFWEIFSSSNGISEILFSSTRWEYFFAHWSGIVRDHYMRVIAYKVCVTHPQEIRLLLMRSFETSLLENCQLRDCLPSNPIPNKRFIIRPINIRPQPARGVSLSAKLNQNSSDFVYDDTADLENPAQPEGASGFVKKKLGLIRGLWADDTKEIPCSTAQISTPLVRSRSGSKIDQPHADDKQATPASEVRDDGSSRPLQMQTFRFVAEYVGKQWSLTSDADAIRFLDSVMDAARDGRLPLHSYHHETTDAEPAADARSEPRYIRPYELGCGRKRLWTRSLSEWSTLLDETDRFWATCGGRSLSSYALSGHKTARRINCPRLEVDFPRWFVQRSTQIAGDGLAGRV